jgi:hypothetical protein
LQAEDGPELTNTDGSPFHFAPTAPIVLFGKNAPSLDKVLRQVKSKAKRGTSKTKVISKRQASDDASLAPPKKTPRKAVEKEPHSIPEIVEDTTHSDNQV